MNARKMLGVVFGFVSVWPIGLVAAPAKWRVEVNELGRYQKKDFGEFWASSEDGLHLAYRANAADGKKAMFHDGKLHAVYKSLGKPIFSPNGERMAYRAWTGEKAHVVADGVAGKAFDNVLGETIVFSGDSRRVAYLAKRGEQWLAVVDGKEYPIGGGFDKDYYRPVFSGDAKRVVLREYAMAADKNQPPARMCIDGKWGPAYARVWRAEFSADSKRVLYVGQRKGEGERVVVDGVEGPAYDEVDHHAFTADSKRYVYRAKKGEKWHVVVDGKASEAFDKVIWCTWFRPRVMKLGCAVQKGKSWYAWIEGKLHGPYEYVTHVRISPDGRRWACVVGREFSKKFLVVDGKAGRTFSNVKVDGGPFSPDSKRIAYRASKMLDWWAVIDADVGEPYRGAVTEIRFSPDSKRTAYVASKESGKVFVVVDGKAGETFRVMYTDHIYFSPDSRHFAYAAKNGRSSYAVIDGRKSEPCSNIIQVMYRFVFSHTGGHFACVGRKGEPFVVLLDGQAGPEFNSIIENGPAFRPDGTLEYLAWRKGVLCRVRHVPVAAGE